jgi:hypothetical protein
VLLVSNVAKAQHLQRLQYDCHADCNATYRLIVEADDNNLELPQCDRAQFVDSVEFDTVFTFIRR